MRTKDIGDHFSLIRSKDAGPFVLTIDIFFTNGESRRAFQAAQVFSPQRIGDLYGVDPEQVQVFDLPDIGAMKISFPRPTPSGNFRDTDVTGGQQYALLVQMLTELSVRGAGPSLVVEA